MKIIDAHAHIFPGKIEGPAVHAISDFYFGMDMPHKGSSEELLESGSKIGVSYYLVFSAATVPTQVERINDFIIGECEKHPEFLGAGTMHAAYAAAQDYEGQVEKLYQHGVKGIKLHPDFQNFNIDDERMMPVYAALARRGMFMITHSGDYRYDYSHPKRVAHVAERFPELRVIAAHFGGWMQWPEARAYLNLPNVYFDTSSTMGFSGPEPALAALEVFDHSHIFFATDFPMWDHRRELQRFLSLGLDEKTRDDILYNNFAAFYGL